MKVLFVCTGNVSRSQMAAALYNRMTSTQDAESAGTAVPTPGETLGERRARNPNRESHSLTVMQADSIDLSENPRTQLTPQMLDGYDRIISMADEDSAPDWLKCNPRYTYWQIADPRGLPIEATVTTKRLIEQRLRELIDGS